MRRLAVAVVIVASLLGGTHTPAVAAGATVVSGVAVFSPAIVTVWVPIAQPSPWQSLTITETQQGVFAAGVEVETANVSCTFSGYANETYALGWAVMQGSCAGTGVTGKRVTKTCQRAYNRLAQWLTSTESCTLQVGSSTIATSALGTVVAHLPSPPTDRFYYTGTLTEVNNLN